METRKIIRKCKWCGKSFYADIRNVKRGWGLYCSKKCAAKAREQCKKDNFNEEGFGIISEHGMTVKQLYNWAVKNGYENIPITVRHKSRDKNIDDPLIPNKIEVTDVAVSHNLSTFRSVQIDAVDYYVLGYTV